MNETNEVPSNPNIVPLTPPSEPSATVAPENTPPTDSRKRLVLTDAAGNIQPESAADAAKYIVQPFPDNTVFRYTENPQKPGTYVLIDSSNSLVAAAVNLGVAQILCEGARLWLFECMKNAANVAATKVDSGNKE